LIQAVERDFHRALRRCRDAADDFADLAVFDQPADVHHVVPQPAAAARPIRDRDQILGPLAQQRSDQIARRTRRREPAEHDAGAVGNVRYRVVEGFVDLLQHS